MKTKKMKNTNPEQSIKDYLYSSICFSTFRFNPISYYVLKQNKTKNKIFKKLYNKKINVEISRIFSRNELGIVNNYLLHTITKSLSNASFLLSTNKSEIKLAKKINKSILVIDEFKEEYLHESNCNLKATFFLKSKIDENKYEQLINKFSNSKKVYLDEVSKDNLMFDQIRVLLLQDDADIYFIGENDYQNYISNCVFELNKISVQI